MFTCHLTDRCCGLVVADCCNWIVHGVKDHFVRKRNVTYVTQCVIWDYLFLVVTSKLFDFWNTIVVFQFKIDKHGFSLPTTWLTWQASNLLDFLRQANAPGCNRLECDDRQTFIPSFAVSFFQAETFRRVLWSCAVHLNTFPYFYRRFCAKLNRSKDNRVACFAAHRWRRFYELKNLIIDLIFQKIWFYMTKQKWQSYCSTYSTTTVQRNITSENRHKRW